MRDRNKELLPECSCKTGSKGSFDYLEDRLKSCRDLTSFCFSPLLKDKAVCGQYASVYGVCVWVTLGHHLSVTRIDPRVWMQAHKSPLIFSFLLLLSPRSSECLYSISVSILSIMTLPIHPLSQTFHTESNATSLGHFILIAKHSNLI